MSSRTSATTSWSCSCNSVSTWDPMKPVAPVSATFILIASLKTIRSSACSSIHRTRELIKRTLELSFEALARTAGLLLDDQLALHERVDRAVVGVRAGSRRADSRRRAWVHGPGVEAVAVIGRHRMRGAVVVRHLDASTALDPQGCGRELEVVDCDRR